MNSVSTRILSHEVYKEADIELLSSCETNDLDLGL